MNKEDHMTTLPKRGLNTSQYKESMDKKDLKRHLKTSQYKESMDKKDLKRLSKSEFIKMLLKQKELKKVHNHEDLLDNDPFNPKQAGGGAESTHSSSSPSITF